MSKYWIGQIGASFVVYGPTRDIVAFRPDEESAKEICEQLNQGLEKLLPTQDLGERENL